MRSLITMIAVVMTLTISAAQSETIPERLIDDLQKDLAITEFQAAAIAGNLAQETGNFRVLQEQKGTGFGYSQWQGRRLASFYLFADEIGDRTGYEANYGFLLKEIKGVEAGTLVKLRRTTTLD